MRGQKSTSHRFPESVQGSRDELLHIASIVIGKEARLLSSEGDRVNSVCQELHHAAEVLLVSLRLEQSAPSSRAMRLQIARIFKLSKALEDALLELPPFMKLLLNKTYQTGKTWHDVAGSLVEPDLNVMLVEHAANLIKCAVDKELGRWNNGTALLSRSGPQNAYSRILGDPRTFAAYKVAQIVGREQGLSTLNAQETGPVCQAVSLLWEYSTGDTDPGEHLNKSIRRSVKSVKLFLLYQKLEAKREEEEKSFLALQTINNDSSFSDEFATLNKSMHFEAARLLYDSMVALWGRDRIVGLILVPADQGLDRAERMMSSHDHSRPQGGTSNR